MWVATFSIIAINYILQKCIFNRNAKDTPDECYRADENGKLVNFGGCRLQLHLGGEFEGKGITSVLHVCFPIMWYPCCTCYCTGLRIARVNEPLTYTYQFGSGRLLLPEWCFQAIHVSWGKYREHQEIASFVSCLPK